MADSPTKQDKFNALLASYTRAYERFIENGFRTSATLLVVLGWLLGSETAQKSFHDDGHLRVFAIVMILLGGVFLIVTFLRLSNLSRTLRRRLDELSFMDSQYYDQHRIPDVIIWSVIGQNLLVCLLICGILIGLSFRPDAPPKPVCPAGFVCLCARQ